MRLLRLLLPFPGRLEFSIRLAVICALTTLVAELYQTPDPALTAYVAFFLIKPDRVTSIILSLVLLLVLSVTLLIVLAAAITVVDDPMWRVGAMTLLSLGLMFLASASKLRSIAPIMALIAAYALDLLGTIQLGEIATRALLYAWLFVGIPAGVSILVNLLGGPAPRRLAERALAHRLRLSAAMLDGGARQSRDAFGEALREGIGEILTWLKLAGVERTSSAAELAALRQAAESTLRIMLLADMARQVPGGLLPAAAAAALASKLNAMAGILGGGSYPIEIEPPPQDPALTPEAAGWYADMQASLTHFAVAPATGAAPAPAAPKPRGGFLMPDAFSNPVHVQHALKTTGAAMFCYILYSLLDWPTIHTCLITCYIVSLGTAAETVEKLTLRILGAMLGAAAGIAAIVFLVPDLTSIGSLMITVFLATLAAAWVAGGDARIAYAGFQIAFAFFLCVLQGNGPSFDMVTARDRVIGILLGNVVVYFVFTTVWPASIAARIDPAIASLLRNWRTLLRSSGSAGVLAASQALVALGAVERDLDLVPYEPALIRPDAEWLAHRRRATEKLAALAGLFWFCAGEDPKLSENLASRLGHLAALVGGSETMEAPAETAIPAAPAADAGAIPSMAALRDLVEGRVDEIETALTNQAGHPMALAHATA